MKALAHAGMFALVVYVGLCAALFLLQHGLIFHPRPVGHPPAGPHVVPATVPAADATLRGWIVNPESAGPVLIYFGGNAEDISGRVTAFATLDATTVLISYRGYGASDGTPSGTDLVRDAGVVVETMRERFGGDREIILFGRSLGAGVAAVAAGAARVDGLILLSPYVSLARIAQQRFPVFPVRWLLRHDIDASAVAATLPERMLVLYARDDSTVPTEESRAFVRLLASEPHVVEFSGAHNAPMTSPPIWEAIEGFLNGDDHTA